MGINCTVEADAVPRMWYPDQIARHVVSKENADIAAGLPGLGLQFHANPEECDFVLRLPDAHYDIAFIRDREGNYVPFFDAYDHDTPHHSNRRRGKTGISGILGAPFQGAVEHWSGTRNAGDQQLHVIGKFLQAYSTEVLIDTAAAQGYSVVGEETDLNGNIHLHVAV